MPESSYWMRRVARRGVLRGGLIAGGGLAAAALIGCGGGDDGGATSSSGTGGSQTTATPAPTVTGTAAVAEGTSKRLYPYTIAESGMAPQDGGTLVLATAQSIGSLDATKSGAIGNLQHIGTSYDSLLRWRMTTNEDELDSRNLAKDIEGNLAESWELSDDGLTYVFHLRPGTKWQNVAPVNGREFTSEDVQYAFDRYSQEGVWKEKFAFVDSIETPDPNTITVKMTRPSPDFVVPLAEQNLTIFPREIAEDGSIDRVMIGTGAMIAKELVQAEGAKYERNPDWWGGKAHLDGKEFRVIPDAAARLAAYRAKQVSVGGAGSVQALKDALGTNPDSQVYQSRPIKAIFCMTFNQTLPKWQDVRVRRALHMGIDREEINGLLYDGQSATWPIIPYFHVLDSQPDPEKGELGAWWKYDPDEAVKLLSAAGAEKLEIDFMIYRGYVGDQNDVWVDQYRRIGVDLKLRDADYVEFNSQLAGVTYPDAIGAWDPHGTEADNYFRNQVLSTSPGNWHHINDPELDQWAEEQSVELDPQVRREILRKIWDKLLDDAHRVEHTNTVGYTLVQPNVHGLSWTVGNDGLAATWAGYNSGQFISNLWMSA